MPPHESPHAPVQAREAGPRLLVTPLVAFYALVYLLWKAFGGGSTGVRDLVSELVFLPVNATLVVLFGIASRNAILDPGLRRAGRYLSWAAAAVMCGNLVNLALLLSARSPVVSLADIGYLLDYPLTLAAFLSIPLADRRTDRWKFVCDAGMVLAGGGVAMWYFLVRPTAQSAAGGPFALALTLIYPLADLLLLVGIVHVVLRRPAPGNAWAIRWLSVGAGMSVLSDLAFNLWIAESGRRGASWVDALYLATYVALVASAELFARRPEPSGHDEPSIHHSRYLSAVPFVAALGTYTLLLVIALGHWVDPLSGVAIGAIVVSMFLGTRLLLTYRRSAALLAEAAVRASEARFRSLVQNSSDLIFVLDTAGIIQFVSSSAARVIGYEPDALVGVELAALAPPDDAELLLSFVRTAAQFPGVSPSAEWRLRRPLGDTIPVEAVATNLLADENVKGIVLNIRDVGERKALLDQLAHQAFHDPLTGLANRALFYDRVSHALALAHRQASRVTVLYLDLDDFKQVNDTLGHGEGDRLLTMVAARLRSCARASDTVARLGGDEFAILVEDLVNSEDVSRLAERIREQMSFPFALAGSDFLVSASIGSASADGGVVGELLRHADLAMYSAKRTEKGTHQLFDELMLP